MQCSPRLCSLSVWPCSPLGCTGARSSWGPDCGSTIPALVMVLCGKASPVLTGVDKGCEIVNETLPLLLPVNIINQKKKKKAILQTIVLDSSESPQETWCFVVMAALPH